MTSDSRGAIREHGQAVTVTRSSPIKLLVHQPGPGQGQSCLVGQNSGSESHKAALIRAVSRGIVKCITHEIITTSQAVHAKIDDG